MKQQMTSRERVIAAMKREDVDHVPCSPRYNPLYPEQRVGHGWHFPWGPSELEMAEYNTTVLGVDPVLAVSIEAYEPAPGVASRTWMDNGILHKAYATPAGELHASVRHSALWPHGMNIPFFSDFNIGHFVEPWITTAEDVQRLSHIGRGLTGAMHLFGAEPLCLATVENPALVEAWLELEHRLTLQFMQEAAELGVDIIVRNGFYETCDFYSPATLEHLLADRLTEEADLVRSAGKVAGYVANTGVMPMLDHLARLPFHCIMCLDISFHDVDCGVVQTKLGGSKSFWTGPSGAYDIAQGTPVQVRAAVRRAFESFGPRGLVITACPSSHSIMPWENTVAMIDEWKKLR